jgi:heat shock protein HslJ
MQKTLIGLGILIALLVVGFFVLNSYIYTEKQATAGKDEKNAEYIIAGNRVQLVDGVSEVEAAPGSASKVSTKYFGNGLVTDLNSDGKDDQVFLMTQEQGGSGTFYYVVAAIQTEKGYVGSEALLLGDRIAPQQTRLTDENLIEVTFADRKTGEHFGVPPSVGKSLVLKFDPVAMQFGEVAQNFEGEADPSVMTLDMKKWEWVSAQFEDGRTVVPAKAGAFTLSFGPGNRFSASTDCNGVGGEYTAKDGTIAFEKMMSTLMFCENSQEAVFSEMLTNTTGYHFSSKGELILSLKFDSGTVTFK